MKPNVERMIGKSYRPKGTYDHDGDGVVSIIDCKPYNPRKQGWIHDLAKRKWKEYKERRSEKRGEKSYIRRESREAAREERMAQAVKTAKYREKIKGEQKRTYYKRGGLGGEIGRAFEGTTKIKSKGSKKKQKSKKRYQKPLSISDFKFNY